MTTGTLLYEGKAKKIFTAERADEVVHYFNNKVSERLFTLLEAEGIRTHFVKRLSDREMLTKKVTIVPVEVVVRNIIAGSLAKRLGLKEGDPIQPAIVEFYYKDDALGDPLVNDDHLRLMNIATPALLKDLRDLGHKINAVLKPFFAERQMQLVDFKLEFGVFHNKLVLADEISPDTCRLWDMTTGDSMDKDRFRKDLGKIEEAYQEVLKRVCG
jgi:phosphoribosylaminoimidazole-succinocarboxamide synthase